MIDISICIVNLNARKQLNNCMQSIMNSILDYTFEVIIVDNHSSDGSQIFIEKYYKKFHIIKNKRNVGYTVAINQGIKESKGNYIVLLNPDAVLEKDTLNCLVSFLKYKKDIGIVGPKVLNHDKSFQKSCRRGIARPKAVFSYFLGLSRLFPNDLRFTEYHLNHLHEDEINEVGGVSGSCMVIRKKVVDEIGYFDERYFAYQEDSDYCLTAKKSNWKIYYNPSVKVIHNSGLGGSNTVPMKAIFEWHRSYCLYYKKHFSEEYSTLFSVFYILLMLLKLIFSEAYFLIKS